jgi:hypothetical protein
MVLACGLGGGGLWRARADVLYDNSQYFLTNFYSTTLQFGDEIKLADTNRTVTEFSCEYFGDYVPTGQERARLRFYVADGPDIDPRPEKTIRAPGTVLYDSGPLPIGPGFNALLVRGLAVRVPQVMIWTVEFAGLAGTNGNKAGLLFYDPPTVGSSFDDFWVKQGDGWRLMRLGGNPVANFSSRVSDTLDTPLTVSPGSPLAGGQILVELAGPVGRSVLLEFSTNAVDWASLTSLTFTNRLMRYVHQDGGLYSKHYYRATFLSQVQVAIQSITRLGEGGTRLVYSGPQDGLYHVEASPDLLTWTPILTNVFPAGYGYFTDTARGASRKFYRIRSAPSPGVAMDGEATHPVNQVAQVGVSGPPGGRVIIQASPDLAQWTSIATNMFSFTTGAITIVDTQAPPDGMRFYRALPAP